MQRGSPGPEIQQIRACLQRLRDRGWTLAAIGDELGVDRESVWRWWAGHRRPTTPKVLLQALERLEQRRRIPKQRRYGEHSGGRYVKPRGHQGETPPATDDGTGDG